MADLLTDTVTFLFTDVEISTQLWDRDAGQHEVAATRFGALERAGDDRQTKWCRLARRSRRSASASVSTHSRHPPIVGARWAMTSSLWICTECCEA